MTLRTIKSSVTFVKSFTLGDFDEVLPSGTYEVESDEELLEGISFPAYRRILTLLHLPAKTGNPGLVGVLTINPNELEAALERDRTPTESPAGREPRQVTPEGTTESRQDEADRQAVEQGEDEGMIVPPE